MTFDLRSAKGVVDFLKAFKTRGDVYVGSQLVHLVIPAKEVDRMHFLFHTTGILPMGVDLKLDGTLPWWKNWFCKVKIRHTVT